jgi:putative glutathione S-transferase
MGHFVDGIWQAGWYAADSKGHFVRPATTYREPLQAQALERGDYLLYVSLACPWAHRTLLMRALLGLEDKIDLAVVDWLIDDNSWAFRPERASCTPDPLGPSEYLREVYLRADRHYTGRCTVPICWDKARGTIVNNESREIIRHLCVLSTQRWNFRPSAQVDAVIDKLYPSINNGVYRCGFASSQAAYDEAVDTLFAALDEWESILAQQPFAAGLRLSEADLCFFTTLVRFDPVYLVHFKCSKKRLRDYPHLHGYLRSLYQLPKVADTVNFEHIRGHYYSSHLHLNPTGIVAALPEDDLNAPHDRWQLFPQAEFPS